MNRDAEAILRLRRELAEFCRRSYHRGPVSGAGGNISLKVPGSDCVLITSTNVSLADMEPECNLLIRLDGAELDNPLGLKPSKETDLHLLAYRLRPEIGAVCHVHPAYATALSIKGEALPLVTINSRIILQEVPCVDCAPPGWQELCDFVHGGIVRYPSAKAFLMKEHGILTLGHDIRTAYYLADLVEDTAKIAFLSSKLAKVK